MTDRDRFLETVLFGSPDRVPLEPGDGRKSTREAWYAQGLSVDVTDASVLPHKWLYNERP